MSLGQNITTRLARFEKEFKPLNRVEISGSTILHNFDIFQQLQPSFSILPVLKSNAYGHGLAQITEILKSRTFPYIVVDGYFEALEIRKISPQPILVMGYIHPDNFQRINLRGYTFVIQNKASVEALGKTRKKVTIHIELETGMNRLGVKEHRLLEVLDAIKRFPNLQLEGVMSHLADADNPTNDFTVLQVASFDRTVEKILALGFTPTMFHIAQSAGSVKVHSKYTNALRVGIGLYGYSPLSTSDSAQKKLSQLKPALRVVSTIIKTHDLAAGESVSYGRTFTAKHAMRVGILPFGYYEGLPRVLSNVGSLTYGAQATPIVGRVCMNHVAIDISNTDANQGTEITVFSPLPQDPNSISSLCREHGLFEYVLITGINQNIRRVIVG
jgi:alanine racemase